MLQQLRSQKQKEVSELQSYASTLEMKIVENEDLLAKYSNDAQAKAALVNHFKLLAGKLQQDLMAREALIAQQKSQIAAALLSKPMPQLMTVVGGRH